MYSNSRNFRTFRRPDAGSHSHSRGRFSGGRGGNYQRSGGNFRNVSKLLHADVNMFIKQANPVSAQTEIMAVHNFSDFDIAQPLKENIAHRGFTTPTPIQDQAIGPIIEGKDLVGLANTGTGKTAAFLIPIINKIYKDNQQKALIVVPTRELALQITDELRNLSQGMRVYSTLVIGGANINRQIWDLQRNPHVVIATPGRLKDLIQRRAVYLSDYSTFVLDEVDLMVDIGFLPDVKYFISLLPKVRQSLFFSATISGKIQEVLSQFVQDPIRVSVKVQDTAENINQDIVKVTDRNKKVDVLHDLLIKDGFDKVLIFGKTKHGIEKLNSDLEARGFKVGAIHGDKTQGHRQRVLMSFKQNQIQVLLATDVAARGLDIPNVTHVINYDLPNTYEDYVHRIGRTGRANNIGQALTFVE